MVRASALALSALLVCTAGLARAQSPPKLTVFNEFTTQPEVWRPAALSEPGVDAQGDLNLSIPVLTVPGRNGLNFPVTFSYQSSIPATSMSGWLGTGWSFDPGSITREVQGGIVRYGFPGDPDEEYYNVDWPGESPPGIQPDVYYVTTPAGSFSMIWDYSSGTNEVQPPRFSPTRPFSIDTWRPWKIEPASPASLHIAAFGCADPGGVYCKTGYANVVDGTFEPKEDYPRFKLTAEDGTRYIFEAPTLSTYVGAADDGAISQRSYEHHVGTWRLVAILAPDYPDDTVPDPADSGIYEGGWIRFYYSAPRWAKSGEENGTNIALLSQLQVRYLESIYTPTHRAEFDTGAMSDSTARSAWTEGLYQRLNTIKLYARGSDELIQTVELTHDDTTWDALPVEDYGGGVRGNRTRDMLTGILFVDDAGVPRDRGYAFDYYAKAACRDGLPEGSVKDDCQDDFGFYNDRDQHILENPNNVEFDFNDDDAKAWSLKEVTYPGGARIDIEYENDLIDDGLSLSFTRYTVSVDEVSENEWSVLFSLANRNLPQGGARVTRITRYDGVDANGLETTYDYGPGRVSGIPTRRLMRSLHGSSNLEYHASDQRGKAAVYYTQVRATRTADGTSTTTHYSTDAQIGNEDGLAEPITTVLFVRNTVRTATVTNNSHINWGLVTKTTTSGASPATQEVVRTHEVGLNKLAEAFLNTANSSVPIYWRYHNTLKTEMETQDRLTVMRSYEYDSGHPQATGLRTHVDETADGKTRRQSFTYAREIYNAFESANRLSDVARVDQVACGSSSCDGAGDVHIAASITTWAIPLDQSVWRPSATYAWKSDAQGGTPPSWSGGEPGTADWQRQVTFVSYSPQGYVTQQIDGNNNVTDFHYGSSGSTSPCGSIPTSAPIDYLACIKRGDLFQRIDYDTKRRISRITDSNGLGTGYEYDSFNRLSKVCEVDLNATPNGCGAALAEHEYRAFQSHPPPSTTPGPDNVVTVSYLGDGFYDRLESAAYYDGLGNILQQQTRYWEEPLGSPPQPSSVRTVVHTEFDVFGRPVRAWKPFEAYGHGGLLSDAGVASGAQSYYQLLGSGLTLYTETQYTADGFSRVARETFPHQGDAPAIDYVYGSTDLEPDGTRNNAALRTVQTTDEEGRPVLSVLNTRGQEVYQVRSLEVPADANTPAPITLSVNSESGDACAAPAGPVGTGDTKTPLNVNFSWYCDSATFQVDKPQLVFYEVTFSVTGNATGLLNVTVGDGFVTQVGYDSSDPSKTHTVAFYAQTGQIYTVTASAGIEETKGSASTDATIRFEQNGTVSELILTGFEYDDADRLVAVFPPMAYVTGQLSPWATRYRYNTLGQLIEKTTPDADGSENNDPTDDAIDYSYNYDANGNLIAVVDPRRRGSGFLYTEYDAFNRVTETGVCASGSPGNTCTAARSEVVAYEYDTATPTVAPPAGFTINYPKGHLTQIIYQTPGFADNRMHFSYDARGRVEAMHTYLSGLGSKVVRYAYDRQGNLTKVSYQPDEVDAFYTWYDYSYDTRGMVQSVWTHTVDDRSTATREAKYAYNAAGQVETLRLGDPGQGAIAPINYAYHIRDWLTAINDPAALNDNVFAMKLGYDASVFTAGSGAPTYRNGNIGSIAWAGKDGSGNPRVLGAAGETVAGYTFTYDDLNRLTGADAVAGLDGSDDGTDDRYDVSPITYDANGNILSLHRQWWVGDAATGSVSPQNLSYSYVSGSNRLNDVNGLPGNVGPFAYDANGNMTTTRTATGLQYDRRNLPTSLTSDGTAIEYGYDADGQRVWKRVDGATTYYVRGVDGAVLAVYDDTGDGAGPQLTYWNILAGGSPLGRVQPPTP